jgi:N-acetylglutamate synthase-like GNAT family acetyltransferase
VRINPSGLDWRRFIVAVDPSGALIGCGQVKPHGDGTRELASIAVVPPWRGRGVARAIVEHFQAAAGPPLWLTCASRLIPLYHRFGFVEAVADLPPYFRRLRRIARLILFVARTEDYLAIMRWP